MVCQLQAVWERERKGLAVRRVYRTIAPWVAENPIWMHVRQADDTSVKRAIDQCAEVGFEMVILTFGSGFNMEDESPDNLNVPDWYFLNGSSKTGMGYRETNRSLPRKQQEIIERQNVYDGTWEKTPSMGWMFVPLTQYHGGGAAATIEPLKDHLPHYEQRLANLFGAGVQACYRGPRLYDADDTRAVVKKWVDFYKKYRAILDSDIIHIRRADGRDLDCILHVNPVLPIKGLAMVYNPTGQRIQKKITLPLYYTGITDSASIAEKDEQVKKFKLSRDYSVQLPVDVPAYGVTWFVVE